MDDLFGVTEALAKNIEVEGGNVASPTQAGNNKSLNEARVEQV